MYRTNGFVGLLAVMAPFVIQAQPDCGELLLAGRTALNAGRYAQAELHYSGAMVACEGATQVDARLVTALAELGLAKMGSGHYDDASVALRRALSISDGVPGLNPSERAKIWQALGTAYYHAQLFTQAENSYRRALDLRAASGTLDPQLAGELSSNLAVIYIMQHRNDKADAALEIARQALDQSRGTESNWRIHLLLAVGAMYHAQGRSAEAEATLREALTDLDRISDADGTLVVTALNNIAMEYMSRRDYMAARSALSRAIALAEQGVPLSRPEMMKVLTNYRISLQHTAGRKEIREFESRSRLILSAVPPGQTDGLLIDVTQITPKR